MIRKSLEEIRKYDTFIFDKFVVNYGLEEVELVFDYEIVNLKKIKHRLVIPWNNKDIDKDMVNKLAFNIGLLEMVSYWKAVISPNILVNCGTITDKQKEFFKKVYYYGLGEFFYVNKLEVDYDNFLEIVCNGPAYDKEVSYEGIGSLIAIGGGKDSCVTLSIYPKKDSSCFIINAKEVMLDCAYVAGYEDKDIYKIKRNIDLGLLELNEDGFLNGHTPFSAMVAFVSFLTAYLNNKKYIVLSNESSSNEANVVGTKINHQYSKSYEFEKDFQDYAREFLNKEIKYYSFLRPLSEYQIAMLFAKDKRFHQIFKSCNPGSKEVPWKWCCKCAKCLFVYSLLAPFLYKDELVAIFGKDLFEDKELLDLFLELLGKRNVKPFDCVGTFEEINYAVTKVIKRLDKNKLPYLLEYYYENYYDEEILEKDLEHFYSKKNSLSLEEEKLLKGFMGND